VLWRECSYFSSTSAARFKNVTILGGGLMGNGITQVTAAAGYNVTMVRRTRVRPPATALALRACPPLQAGLRSAHPSLTRTPHPRRHTGGRDAGALGQVDGQH
jgi:3-hydroxyacyl-CoA dehydrogenase